VYPVQKVIIVVQQQTLITVGANVIESFHVSFIRNACTRREQEFASLFGMEWSSSVGRSSDCLVSLVVMIEAQQVVHVVLLACKTIDTWMSLMMTWDINILTSTTIFACWELFRKD
jgi:hypothetical protein